MDWHNVVAEVDDSILAVLVELARGKYVVESGTFLGKSARGMGTVADRLDTCDPCDECWKADRHLPLSVSPHHCRGVDFTPDRPIELLFIDSGEHWRSADLVHFAPFVPPSGIIAIDDPHLDGVYNTLANLDLAHVTLPISHGLILAQTH